MNKLFTAALGLAVAVLPVLGVGVAVADTDLSCDGAKKVVVKAQARVDDRAASERVDENKVLDDAQRTLDLAQAEVDRLKATEPVDQAVLELARTARDAAKDVRDRARDALNTDSKRLAELRVLLTAAISDRDKACDEPSTTPPTPTPTPSAEFPVDLDCADLSDAEAQKVLDSDLADPHNLDSDEDGLACDELTDNSDNDVVVTPSGGVNTGGWQK